ncbi:MAG: hypothetical protein IKJ77_04545 [Firmicutes bacterium]|nr:hypothetical protein [Bacillota bacterium]
MKKIMTLVLALGLCFSLASCGAEEVNYGDTITTDFVEIQVSSIAGLNNIEGGSTINEDGSVKRPIENTMSYEAQDGQSYVSLVGTIKNLGSATADVGNFEADFVFDGGETYKGSSYVGVGDSFEYELASKNQGTFFLAAMVPDEVLEKFTTCELTFGFNDGFEYTDGDVNGCDYVYAITATRDAETEGNLFVEKVVAKQQEVKKGDKVTTDFVEMTVKGHDVKPEVKFSKTSGSFTTTTGLYENSGKKYMYIEGSLKNVSKQELDAEFVGSLVVDGYEYEIDEFLVEDASSCYSIEPLASVSYVLYAEIPNELAGNYKSAVLNFGFDEYFKYGTDFEDCPYQFSYKIK